MFVGALFGELVQRRR